MTPTPASTTVAVDINHIVESNLGLGGKYKGLDRDSADRICNELANVRFLEGRLESKWTLPIANYEGSLCQAYLDLVAGNVPISWNKFKQGMTLENGNLTSEDDLLEAHRVYTLLELDQ